MGWLLPSHLMLQEHFLCTHGLLLMHSHSHAACIYQLNSFLFNLQGLTHARFLQTNFYPSQFLHKHSFTPSTFCRITLTFAPTSFYIRHVLHQPTFTNPFHTNQILHKPAFTQTNFFTNHLYANHLLHQPALHNLCFGL